MHPGVSYVHQMHAGTTRKEVSNSMFESTLYGERRIRAHLVFQRPCREPDSINPMEQCFLISVGDELDGKTGRAHGGLNALLLDHVAGHSAYVITLLSQ